MTSGYHEENTFVAGDTLSPDEAEPHTAEGSDIYEQIFSSVVAEPGLGHAAATNKSSSGILAQALHASRIQVTKVAEQVWTFTFAGSVIGGFSHGITNLVSEYAHQVLASDELTRAHMELRTLPMAPLAESEVDETRCETGGLQPEGSVELPEQASQVIVDIYCVGTQALSALAFVELAGLDVERRNRFQQLSAAPDNTRVLHVDVTATIGTDITTLAITAMTTLPGLHATVVRLAVESLNSVENAVIVGIYPEASLVPHHYPHLGPGQPVASALVEKILDDAVA